jgi:hypothetical protein
MAVAGGLKPVRNNTRGEGLAPKAALSGRRFDVIAEPAKRW